MRRLFATTSAAFAGSLLIASGSVATASRVEADALLTPRSFYAYRSSALVVSFVTRRGTVVEGGPSRRIGGFRYELCNLTIICAALAPTDTIAAGPPELPLNDHAGVYSVSTTYTLHNLLAPTSPGAAAVSKALSSVSVTLAGKIGTTSAVSDTVELTGAPCTTQALPYPARFDPPTAPTSAQTSERRRTS